MKRIQWLIAAALIIGGCAPTPPEQAIVNDAASALGGAEKIQP
jgi:PBP1b-binding outer membrane lipoprotein LpoB